MARMELPVLDKFCFIFDLRTGCISLGLLNSVLTFILGVVIATGGVEGEGSAGVVGGILMMLAALLFVKVAADLLLVFAVYTERCGIVKKYCIFWMVFLVLFIIGFLKSLFHVHALLVVAQLVYLAENFYTVVVVRSYLVSINEDGVF